MPKIWHVFCGQSVDSLAFDLRAFGEGRTLDDNANVMLRFEGSARRMLWPSPLAPGNENALKLRIYGAKGEIEWSQEDPNYLWFTPVGEPKRLLVGANDVTPAVRRLPGGHPEGYLEGFGPIDSEPADAIRAVRLGIPSAQAAGQLPGIAAGMAFINACVTSSMNYAAWVKL